MYQYALSRGGPRYDLDGNVAGEVTPEQVEAAAKFLASIDSTNAAKAQGIRSLRRNAKPRVWKAFPDDHPEPRRKPAVGTASVSTPAENVPPRLGLAGLKLAAQARRQASREAVR